MERPDYLTDEHLLFLERLSEAELTNMFFAVPHLLRHYPALTPEQAQRALLYRFVHSAASASLEAV